MERFRLKDPWAWVFPFERFTKIAPFDNSFIMQRR